MKDFLLSDIAFANKTLGIQGYNKKRKKRKREETIADKSGDIPKIKD